MGVAYDMCSSINPSSKNRPERDEEWVKKTLRAYKGDWSKVYERYRYQSGDQDAEDPYAEFAKFFMRETLYSCMHLSSSRMMTDWWISWGKPILSFHLFLCRNEADALMKLLARCRS